MKSVLSIILLILVAGCSSPRDSSDGDRISRDSSGPATPPAPQESFALQTSAAVYEIAKHPAGLGTTIVYTYINRSGAPLYLVNCNGDVSPGLQRERNGVWENAWAPAMNACLSPPVVIKAGETFVDTLGVVVGSYDSAFYKEIGSVDSTQRYRLVWHQALSSFDANTRPGDSGGNPFGPLVPVEQRVSNPFTFRSR